jgi:hypothetical protein
MRKQCYAEERQQEQAQDQASLQLSIHPGCSKPPHEDKLR